MEASQPLSIESFSYSWLVNLKPSLESSENSLRVSYDTSDEASFIEMDPRMPPSRRFFTEDFKFDFPILQSPLALVDADELICNGYLMPLFVDSLKMEPYDASDSSNDPSLSSPSHAPKSVVPTRPQRCHSLRRCRGLSKRLIQKYLDFFRPLFRRLGCQNPSSKAQISGDRRAQSAKNLIYPSDTSPRISVAYSADDWRRSCDSESSILEAVLHCKRSIEK